MANEGVIWCHTMNRIEVYLEGTYLQVGYISVSLLGPVVWKLLRSLSWCRGANIWVDVLCLAKRATESWLGSSLLYIITSQWQEIHAVFQHWISNSGILLPSKKFCHVRSCTKALLSFESLVCSFVSYSRTWAVFWLCTIVRYCSVIRENGDISFEAERSSGGREGGNISLKVVMGLMEMLCCFCQ